MPLEAPVITTTASCRSRAIKPVSYPLRGTHGRFSPLRTGIALRVIDPEQHRTALPDGHSREQYRPLGAYGVLLGAFGGLAAGFGVWLNQSGRRLPEKVAPGDLLLTTVATQKVARLVARDRVTSTLRAPFTRFQDDAGAGEVEERARGTGLRRALGELLVCPYCLGMWTASGFVGGLIVAPDATRWIAAVFTVLSGADFLQIAYSRAESTL
jgi:hypothetical protein